MRKNICLKNTNGVIASKKAEAAIAEYNAKTSNNIKQNANLSVACVMLASKEAGFKKQKSNSPKDVKKTDNLHPTGVPFVCFFMPVSNNHVVIVGMESGKAEIVDKSFISVKHENLRNFKVKGVLYEVKDTINGLPRFVPRNTSKSAKCKIWYNDNES